MNKQQQIDTKPVFESLAKNGFKFLRLASETVESDTQLSIVHFAVGAELILKARLFAEHWALTAEKPHAATWVAVSTGTVKSISASNICRAITSVTGDSLNHEQRALGECFESRNRVVHWSGDLDVTIATKQQYVAWYYLHRLLLTKWKQEFVTFHNEVAELNTRFSKYRSYLAEKYEMVRLRLIDADRLGQLAECRLCTFKSVEIHGDADLFWGACQVCSHTSSYFLLSCDRYVDVEEDFPEGCECGEQHDLSDHFDDEVICSDCMSAATVSTGDGRICFVCDVEFSGEPNTCGSCGQLWVGNSEFRCEQCRYDADWGPID